MTISGRSYLLAGVAAVAAGAVALAPVQVLPPDVTVTAEQRAAGPAVSQQAVELLAAVQGMTTRTPHATVPPEAVAEVLEAVQDLQARGAVAAPSALVTEPAPAAFPGAENAIKGAYNTIEPYVRWGFGVAQWAVGWVPWIGLLAPQIGFFYNFGEAIARSVVYNFADWVGGSVSFGQGLSNIGTATSQAVSDLITAEVNWVRGFFPPLPPLPPISSAATAEPIATASDKQELANRFVATALDKDPTAADEQPADAPLDDVPLDDTPEEPAEKADQTDTESDDILVDDGTSAVAPAEPTDNVAPADRLKKPAKPTIRETLRDRLRSATDSLEKARDLGKPRQSPRRTVDSGESESRTVSQNDRDESD